jgi:hypothetical protein
LPAHFKVHEYEVKQCFCTECNLKQNFEDCVHIETADAGSEDDDEVLVPINIAEESGNFFYIVYANVKMHGNRSYYISHTETLTSMLTFIWYESGFNSCELSIYLKVMSSRMRHHVVQQIDIATI